LIKCPKVGNKKYAPNKYGLKNHKFNTFEFISLQGIPLSELAIKTAFFLAPSQTIILSAKWRCESSIQLATLFLVKKAAQLPREFRELL